MAGLKKEDIDLLGTLDLASRTEEGPVSPTVIARVARLTGTSRLSLDIKSSLSRLVSAGLVTKEKQKYLLAPRGEQYLNTVYSTELKVSGAQGTDSLFSTPAPEGHTSYLRTRQAWEASKPDDKAVTDLVPQEPNLN